MIIEISILRKVIINSLHLLCVLFVLFCSSCDRKNYLEKAIRRDAIICPIVSTNDSDRILIHIPAQDFLRILKQDANTINSEKKLYDSMKALLPINVSKTLYNQLFSDRICVDSSMNVVYREFGVCGLIDRYFKKEAMFGGVYILSNQEQMFPIKGDKPYPSFGLEHNIGYMTYLLSKHHIFLRWSWIDEDGILILTLAEEVSDMNQLMCLTLK